jgi:hypothetical protein
MFALPCMSSYRLANALVPSHQPVCALCSPKTPFSRSQFQCSVPPALDGAVCVCPAVQTAAVTSFVREHVMQRADSLQMLAVRHGVTVPCLKRVNNLMSDHALHSRTSLFIPGGTCSRQGCVAQFVAAHATGSCGEGKLQGSCIVTQFLPLYER